MTTIMPQSEQTRKAIAWVSEKIDVPSESVPASFIEEAAMRFNLSPKDVEFLQRFFTKKQD
ncbi:hypothetical protein GO013_06695 [Pseudodesulfovibrio sp. JC047]|uniref:hypothetical protein n=1 Tax=Pseudodesulfovibrio sp. JC047 TaxID=2683199 RepID=UPI0013D2B0DA|nr:hypothetical protein [Pseudodesulfovibrio sp. JC047]NDV19106.1 hypothetical protein [Pseudodesulfovibrio sp. JC047]